MISLKIKEVILLFYQLEHDMKKWWIYSVVVLFVIGCIYTSCKQTIPSSGDLVVHQWFDKQQDSLITELVVLDSLNISIQSIDSLKQQFLKTRLRYKKMEALVEYYFQGMNKRINGPALPDVKTDDNQVFPPHGFQVLEQILFSTLDDSTRKNLSSEIHILETDLRFIKTNIVAQKILPRHLNEMLQHQLIRIGVLGIVGLDAPLSKWSLKESAAALVGVESILYEYTNAETAANKITNLLKRQFKSAQNYLNANNDFDQFDRMGFLQNHLMPLSNSLVSMPFPQQAGDSIFVKPFAGSLKQLMEGKGFNPDYYSNYSISASSPAKIALGKKLFSENGLSKSSTISCASCHNSNKFLTDGLIKASNIVHGGKLARNTPTLFYAALQSNQFYDMRSTTLEDQVNEVMNNSEEFNLSSTSIAERLANRKIYEKDAIKAFGKKELGGFEIRNALAVYIRSLNLFNARFDEYMRGNKTAMNQEEINGFNIFSGKAKCGTCHFTPLFNGNIPPWYTKSESEIIGVPASIAWKKAVIDQDSGRYKLNRLNELMFAFKTPSLRNVDKTAPYMHNGVYKNLEQVVKFYELGGGVGIGINLPFQSLPFDSLVLTSQEKKAIVAFMKTLTDQ